ncbi:hypothetical protein ACVWYN_002594 [Pedobacter sp. UYP24]
MKRILIGLLLAIPVLCSAQTNLQRGYIVNNAKDTLEGYIDYRPRVNSASTFRFKPGENGAMQTMTLENCKAYGINGDEKFERFSVDISQGPSKVEQLKVGLDSSVKTATVFLKVIQKGSQVSLYSYTDDIKERFYLKDSKSNEPYELIRTKYLEAHNISHIISRDRYKGQLMFEMRNLNIGTSYFEGDMDNLNYNETEIRKIVSIMNREVVRVAKKNTRVFVGFGVSNTSPKYTGKYVLANDAAIKTSSLMPTISIGADLFNGSTSAFFVYRAELSVLMGKGLKIANGENVHSFDHITLCLNPKVMANLYNTDKIKVFLGIGGLLNYSKFNNNKAGRVVPVSGSPDQFVENDIALTSTTFAYNFNAGVLLNKRIEAGVTYTPGYSISNYNAFAVKLEIMQFGIKYHFGK